MYDIECPYCDEEQDICHDDGFGYEEDKAHEIQCPACDKFFVFETTVSFYYRPSRADCLNGSPHDLRDTSAHDDSGKVIVTRCRTCDFEAWGKAAIEKAHEDAKAKATQIMHA